MKAIYINLDPYLQAFADWLNAGKPGTAPCFDPLPLAVTIPLGETAAILWTCEGDSAETEPNFNTISVDGQTIYVLATAPGAEVIGNAIAFNQTPGLSALAPGMKYAVKPVDGDSAKIEVSIGNDDLDLPVFAIPVLVRRETASGPVDLVDFTPPAAAPSAADIKSALVAAGEGALAGVNLGGAIIVAGGEGTGTAVLNLDNTGYIQVDPDTTALSAPGAAS